MAATRALLLPGLDGTGDLFEPFASVAPPGIETVVVNYPYNESSMEVLEKRARAGRAFDHHRGIFLWTDRRQARDRRESAGTGALQFFHQQSFLSVGTPRRFPFISSPPRGRTFVLHSDSRLPAPLRLAGIAGSSGSCGENAAGYSIYPSTRSRWTRSQVLQADERQTLRALAKPVLYLRGLSDGLLSENCWHVMQNVCPDAQIVRVEGPHMLLQVSPNECWKAIVRFMEEL